MNIKKQVKTALIGSMVLGQMMSAGVLAAPKEAINEFKNVREIEQTVGHFKGEIKLYIVKDGNRERVDQKMKDGLRVVEGRTCVGVRDIVNAIEGAEVNWDGVNKIVDITYNGKTLSYPLSKPVMWTDGKMVTIDVPAQVDPSISRTFLPIRNIAENLGFKVDWDQQTKEVTLTPGAGTAQTQTQNTAKGGTCTLSTGHTLPKFGVAPKDYNMWPTGPNDYTDNGDGTITFAKGTEWETQLPKRNARRVESSPANPNFKILGENNNDSRVNTYIIGPGEAVWERVWAEYGSSYFTTGVYKDGKKIEEHNSKIKYYPSWNNYNGDDEGEAKIETLLNGREIKAEYVDEFLSKSKFIDCEHNAGVDALPKRGDKFYDGTGIFDPSLGAVSITYGPVYNGLISLIGPNDSLILDTNGNYYADVPYGREIVVDKIMLPTGSMHDRRWIIIDLPNFKHKTSLKDYGVSINYTRFSTNNY